MLRSSLNVSFSSSFDKDRNSFACSMVHNTSVIFLFDEPGPDIFKDSNSPNVVMSWSSKIVTWIKTFQETLGPIKYHEGDNWLYGFVQKLDR